MFFYLTLYYKLIIRFLSKKIISDTRLKYSCGESKSSEYGFFYQKKYALGRPVNLNTRSNNIY